MDIDALIETGDYVLLRMLQQRLRHGKPRPALKAYLDQLEGDEEGVDERGGATPADGADKASVDGRGGAEARPSDDEPESLANPPREKKASRQRKSALAKGPVERKGHGERGAAEDEHVLEASDSLLRGKLLKLNAKLFKQGTAIPVKDCFVVKQAGDGLCLYASVAEWLAPVGNAFAVRQLSAEAMGPGAGRGEATEERRQLVDALVKASNRFILDNNKLLKDANIISQDDVAYAQRSIAGDLWGGMAQICAMSFLLNAPIVVWTRDAASKWHHVVVFSTFYLLQRAPSQGFSASNKLSENRQGTVIHLLYNGSHYDTLVIAKRETRS